MQTLRATQFFSGRLPGDEVVTLHSGNVRAFSADDAAYLLAEYGDRFEVAEPEAAAEVAEDAAAAEALQDTGDGSLVAQPPVKVPPDVETFGAQAGKGKKGRGK